MNIWNHISLSKLTSSIKQHVKRWMVIAGKLNYSIHQSVNHLKFGTIYFFFLVSFAVLHWPVTNRITCLLLNTCTLRSDGVPLSGESPARQDFPRQSHCVDARRDFSRWPHRPCWVRGRNSDLGLVIDIAQLLLSNVRMREMCWHGDLMQSRCAQQKPLNRDCPRQAGAFDDCLDGRS